MRKGFLSRWFFIVFLFTAFQLSGSPYPDIRRLTQDDPLYRQVSSDIAAYYKYEKQGTGYLPSLSLYRYKPQDDESLFTIASRMNLPYETIALLNGLQHPEELEELETILLPNLPGLFLPASPKTELERIMAGWRDVSPLSPFTVVSERGEESFFFLPGSRFHAVERAYFLGILFRLPLDGGIITSRFGTRISPITGELHHHNGIDFAAPLGTPVYAARDGLVEYIGSDSVFGIHVILSHSQEYETLYGHLESLQVELHQRVYSGMILGAVGETGLTTGPHLHFEIRRKGEARDPFPLMPLF
ncbi:MAG: M23 family metallopeptidase [Spirochaetales bacterium]|nr:M23 family metallopeptidase [Spirochaetales bacterium]